MSAAGGGKSEDDDDKWSMGTARSQPGSEDGAAPAQPVADATALPPPPPPKLRLPPPRPAVDELASGATAAAPSLTGGIISPAARRPGRCCVPCASVCEYTTQCIRWCSYETHDMLCHWLCPSSIAELPTGAKLRLPAVRFNPLYWLAFGGTVPFLIVGVVFHDAIGQGPAHFEQAADAPSGEPARPRRRAPTAGVAMAEKHIRVHWLYMTDAFYFLELLVGLAEFFAAVARQPAPRRWTHALTESVCTGVLLPYSLVVGNIFFLSAIQRRLHWTTRYFILVNGCYALSKVVNFLYMLTVALRLPDRRLASAGPALLYASAEAAMFVLATLIYSRLWSGYQDYEFEAVLAAAERAAAHADRSGRLQSQVGARGEPASSAAGGGGGGGGGGDNRPAAGGWVEERVASPAEADECGAPAAGSLSRTLLRRESSRVVLVPGFGALRDAIEGFADRLEERQATALRVHVSLPGVGADEVPLWTLCVLVLSCMLIWALTLSNIFSDSGSFQGEHAAPPSLARVGGGGELLPLIR